MASSERQLVVKIVGEAKGLNSAITEAEGGLNRLKAAALGIGAAIGAAFAATKVVDFLGDATRAAIEDEKSQALLAQTLRDTTAARTADIASVEQWITSTQNSTGIIDDSLRPALQTLLTSTHDVAEAQALLQTAMDVSVSRGLDLETVSLAIAKAHNGNTTSLGRLGIAYKDTEGNALSFSQVIENANTIYGGAAQTAADTTAGKMAILNGRFQDLKEEIGGKLLPTLVSFATWVSNTLIPTVSSIWENFWTGAPIALNYVINFLNSIKQAFIHAVNAIIRVLQGAIDAADKVLGPLMDFGELKTFDVHAADIPNVSTGGGKKGPGFSNAIGNLADAAKAVFAAGAIANVEGAQGTPSGGGKAAKTGKTDAEKQKEADDKLIGDALRAWAKARDDRRSIEDNMYDNDLLSFAQYKDILQKRLDVAVAGSTEWTQIQNRLLDVTKQYQDAEVKNAQDQADALKKIQDQRIHDMEEALAKTQEIQDNEYKEGAISADEYLGILRGRLSGLEQFTNEWTSIFEEIKRVSENAGYATPTLASVGASASGGGPGSMYGGTGLAQTFSISNLNVTANNADQLVASLNDYARRNGGLRIPGGVTAT